ncbi:hypothetical protein O6H91_10G050400 [Diphasiastrum complanatum]|uniref:Uncharacterized protein n=1 Tax=Diphasiastrum complanatum TaxID=34168 RepID=A0ACC2CHT3_DIPCM|nr:hypothetical protein O6H91_10G050400 [Diphasiastrum complanatum]
MSGSRNILSGAALQDIMSKMFHWWQQPARQGMQRPEEDIDKEKVALVLGVTGIVGSTLAETLLDLETWNVVNPCKVYGVARRPKPEWFMKEPEVAYIQCDLLNREETMAKLSLLVDVTHVFWVVWANMRTEEENSTLVCKPELNITLVLLIMWAKLQLTSRHYTKVCLDFHIPTSTTF